MSGLDAPDIASAYESVRDDKDETNWLLLRYKGVGNALELAKTGTGGLDELAAEFDEAQAMYAYARVEYANDTESKRVKFVLVVWIGEGTKVIRKARVSVESGEVKKAFQHHAQVDARDKSDLDVADIVKRLRSAGGADYDGQGAGRRKGP